MGRTDGRSEKVKEDEVDEGVVGNAGRDGRRDVVGDAGERKQSDVRFPISLGFFI